MADYSVTDPEVIAFTQVVDGLPDNTVGSIGPTDVRAVYKSAVPRYFTLSVSNYTSGSDPLWTGTAEVPVSLPDQAVNKRVVANGLTLFNNGAITYDGHVPMLVILNLNVRFIGNTNTNISIKGYHSNAVNNEPLFTLATLASQTSVPVSIQRMFIVTAGSQILFTRTLSGTTTDTSFTIDAWNCSISAHPLVPATTEIRGGTYGSQNAQSALFSELPFTILYPLADASATFAAGAVISGSYGFTPGAAGDNTMAIAASTSWVPVTPHIIFSAVSAASDAHDLGADGDFYAFGSVSDPSVSVYGPKESGYWPLYPRTIPIGSLA